MLNYQITAQLQDPVLANCSIEQRHLAHPQHLPIAKVGYVINQITREIACF